MPSKPSNRIAAHTDESCQYDDRQNPRTAGQFYVQFIMENEAGYTPSRALFQTLEAAKAHADAHNKRAGLSAEDVLAIRDSSRRKGRVPR